MELITKKIAETIPPLYAQENAGQDAIAYVKFFAPWSAWTWFALEFDGEDTFFGLVVGHETELGYFSLTELKALRGIAGLSVERDLYFEPTKISELAGA